MKTILLSARLPFLMLTPACLLLSVAMAHNETGSIDVVRLLLILLAAVSAHVSVNLFNEYSDFKNGLDQITNKTPFSGGSGGLLKNPQDLNAVLISAVISLAISVFIGLYFVVKVSYLLLPFGLLGILLVILYTEWINKSPWLCLFAPGLAFGPVMVVGGYIALTGEITSTVMWISLIPFVIVNNLLLLNQLPDIDADRLVGRNHIPIKYGCKFSLMVFGVLTLVAALILVFLVLEQQLSPHGLWALMPILSGIVVMTGISRSDCQHEKMVPFLALNVVIVLSTPVIIGISLL